MSFKKQFYKNIAILGGFSYSEQLISFIGMMVSSRLLLPSDFGFVAKILVFTGFVNIFVDAGFSSSIIRSDYGLRFQKGISNLSLILGLSLFITISALAIPISHLYHDNELVLPLIAQSTIFVILSSSTVQISLLKKQLKFAVIGQIQIVGVVIHVSLIIILALLGFRYWSLIISEIIRNLVTFFLFQKKSGFKLRIHKWAYTVVAYRNAKKLIGSVSGLNLIGYWAWNIDRMLVGRMFGDHVLGLYNRGFKLYELTNKMLTNIFGTVLFPSLKDLKQKGGDVKTEFLNILGVISFLAYPIVFAAIIIPKFTISMLFGEQWKDVAIYLPYFGMLIFFHTLTNSFYHIFVIYNKEGLLFKVGFITSVVAIAAKVIAGFYGHDPLPILQVYVITTLAFSIPLNLYFGFFKGFNYSKKVLFGFWLPKMILWIGLIYGIWIDSLEIKITCLAIYLLHIIHYQFKDIIKSLQIIKVRFKK